MNATTESERYTARIMHALHDAIVRAPGGSRFTREGRPIKPMGPKLAAEIIHTTADQVRNMVDPNKGDHRIYFDQFVALLLEGMDPAPLDEIERAIGRFAISIPDVAGHDDLSTDLMNAIKEFGDVGRSMSEALADGKVTPREFDAFDRQTKALLWLAQRMGIYVRLDDGKLYWRPDVTSAGITFDLSGDTSESKGLLWDVEGWLGEININILSVQASGFVWEYEDCDMRFGGRIFKTRPEAIQAAVQYLYAKERKDG